MQAVFGRFQRDALMMIGNHPVQAGNGQPFAERGIHQVHAVQQGAGILYGSAAAQQPGDQLKLGNIILAGFIFAIPGVAHKVQPCNAQAFLVDSIVVERILLGHIGHTAG